MINSRPWRIIVLSMHRTQRTIHLMLLLAFMTVALFMFYFFAINLISALKHPTHELGILSSFGTLLVLWTMTELIHAELMVLKGHKFGVVVLIDVAIATVIRQMLVTDFKAGINLIYFLVSLIVLSHVRFTINKEAPIIKDQTQEK